MRVTIQVDGSSGCAVDIALEDSHPYHIGDGNKTCIDALLTEAVRKVRLAYEIEVEK